MIHPILLIDDDPSVLMSMKTFLEKEGCFMVKAVASPEEGVALVRQKAMTFSLGLIDYHMPGTTGAKVIRKIREYDPKLTLLAFSGDDSIDVHNQTLDSGAIFFVSKDTENEKLLGIIYRICREVELKSRPLKIIDGSDNAKLIQSVGITGVSKHLGDVAGLIHKYAPANESVLILGENGTGKELIAEAIHRLSPRTGKAFVAVNCAAIPKELIESELFGHEKGAFTGAASSKTGKFEAANGGTIFLDEIGDMPYRLQATLLRVLEKKTVTPVGSNATKRVDVRVVAATNAPLEKNVELGLFRQDLYYRLNVLPIQLLPLRERPEDIPVLAQKFVEEANHDNNKNKILTREVADELKRHLWPGNVRDLKHAIIRMVLTSEGTTLDMKILEPERDDSKAAQKKYDYDILRVKTINEEKRIIIEALEVTNGRISEAARRVGMRRSTFCDRMKKHGIELPKVKPLEGA